jgi:phospholipase/carboxylesterase
MTLGSHIHRLVAGTDPSKPPLVLLHGSAGAEDDLIPLAANVAPGSALLAIRGNVPFEDGSAFFRRFHDRTIDEADLRERAAELADFIAASSALYSFDKEPIALGFSNGAIMAAALLLTRPGLLSAAVLLRPLSPFSHDPPTHLPGTPVLIIDGETDRRRSPGDGRVLADRLTRIGARVSHHLLPIGHAATTQDEPIVRNWLLAHLAHEVGEVETRSGEGEGRAT